MLPSGPRRGIVKGVVFLPRLAHEHGLNNAAAAMVVSREIANSLPMLDVPGWLENQRLPKAVAVVIALNVTARVSTDCSSLVCPSRHAMM